MKYKNLTVTFMDTPDSLSYTTEFKDAVISLGSNHIIITTHSEDGNSVKGEIFPLDKVVSYKADR
jgi:hypothetical protein